MHSVKFSNVEEVFEKKVGGGGHCGRIYLHKKYAGRTIKIVILAEKE